MDLLSNLNSAMWQNAPADKVNGLRQFAVVRAKMLQQGKYEFSVRENIDDAIVTTAVLDGVSSKNNPLASVRNVELKLDGGIIVAINLDDDCVVKK